MKDIIRYIARFKVEAADALKIGSGEKGVLIDNLIARDANGLPYIPGTSLAGVIKHELEERSQYAGQIEALFGYQRGDEGQGSRIIFSPALLLADDNRTVHEGLAVIDFSKPYYAYLQKLPERDHVRINDKGGAVDHAKYEEELVPKGTRFVFEIEVEGTKVDEAVWQYILSILDHPTFRVGAGTRKGFGQLKVVERWARSFDLENEKDLTDYLQTGSSLNSSFASSATDNFSPEVEQQWLHYQVELTPESFFLFGAGMGDKDVDKIQKTEKYFNWEGNQPVLVERTLIPATSIKGAIAHRLAFHYNNSDKGKDRLTIEQGGQAATPDLQFDAQQAVELFDFGLSADQLAFPSEAAQWDERMQEIRNYSIEDSNQWQDFIEQWEEKLNNLETGRKGVGEQNEAVRTLFGYANEEEDGARGKVVFSDIYLDRKGEKIFNHVKIDRFTGGGIDGALFQEKVVNSDTFSFDLFVERDALENETMKEAFELTLTDLTTGMLQLGGATTKGHGVFTGSWELKTNDHAE